MPGVVSRKKGKNGVFLGRTRGLVVQREWRVERIVLLRKRRESRRLLFRARLFFYKLIKTSLSVSNLFFSVQFTQNKKKRKKKEKKKNIQQQQNPDNHY